MGKSKLFGSGSGKPVNSVKVTEFAGEDIPANCFVQKLEGSSIEAIKSFQGSSVYNHIRGAWMDNEVFIACNVYKASSDSAFYNHILSFKNTANVVDLKFTQYSSSTELRPWVVMKGSRQMLFGYSAIHHAYSATSLSLELSIKVDKDGIITKELESYTWTPSGKYGTIIVGTYDEDFFYSFSAETANATSVNIYKNTVSSTGVQATLFKTLTTGVSLTYLSPSVYVPELNWILFLPTQSTSTEAYRKYAAYDITNDEWVVNCTPEQNLYAYLNTLATFEGKALVLPKNKKLIASQDNYRYVYTVNLATGEYIPVEIVDPVEKKFVQMLGTVEENGFPETTLLCLENAHDSLGDTIFLALFDLLTGITTRIVQIRDYYQHFAVNRWFSTKYRGRSRFWIDESYVYTTSSAYVRCSLNDFSYAHIEIFNGKPLYGITVSALKTGEKGSVYVADSTYASAAYTTYGITEALATQIVDDSVDEIKQEVTM